MDQQKRQEWRAKDRERCFEDCRGREFVRTRFVSYPSLRLIEPDEDGWYVSEPYTGQAYDPEVFWVCEDGWDHEHCHVCNAHIDPGDEYWLSPEPWPLELCLACHQHLAAHPA
jgi:hypothetical protein